MTTTQACANPITTEIIRNAFNSAANEMCESLFRSSYTPIIYEMKDCAVALFNENLEALGQSTGVPLFLGNLEETIAYAIRYYGGVDDFHDGDIFILNDSYISGTHLNDVTVFAPIFYHDELVGFSANRAHWLDVGSKSPAPPMDSESIFQEGFRMGPLKIVDAGVPRQDLIDTICLNCRFKRNAHGDLNGQIAACKTGEKRLRALIDRFGTETIRQATKDIFRQTEELEREVLKSIPAGEYHYEAFLDNDGTNDKPVPVKMKLTISAEGDMVIDLSGSSPQVTGSTNCGAAQTISACRVAYKMLVLPNAPVTGGSFKGLSVIVPEGSIFDAKEPAAFSWYFSALGLLNDMIIGALAPAAPHLTAGAHYGDSMVCYLSGINPENGEFYLYDEPTVGGFGGFAEADGEDCLINVTNGDFKNFPVEIFEHKFPIMVDRYAIRTDSEGAGQNRGGTGVVREYRALYDDTFLYLWFERSKMPAWGILGGQSAKGPDNIVYDENGNEVTHLLKANGYRMQKGWKVKLQSGGGGGYGDPLQRDVAKVQQDVKQGFISRERAAAAYGVVLDAAGEVDVAATDSLRRKA